MYINKITQTKQKYIFCPNTKLDFTTYYFLFPHSLLYSQKDSNWCAACAGKWVSSFSNTFDSGLFYLRNVSFISYFSLPQLPTCILPLSFYNCIIALTFHFPVHWLLICCFMIGTWSVPQKCAIETKLSAPKCMFWKLKTY